MNGKQTVKRKKREYIKKIVKILNETDLWILEVIYRFTVNMTKEG